MLAKAVLAYSVKDTRYLGVDLASDLSWKSYIERTCFKANRQLAFLRRNLQIQNTRVKETAYKGLVRPITEYCCTVWDPNYKKYKNQLESVQIRAARFVQNRYERQAPVTEMVNNLGWDPLELRRLRARLTMLFKIQQNLVAVPMPSVISVPVRSTPRHPHDFQHMYTSTNSYKYSFFIHTVHQWNLLPPSISSMTSLSSFKAAMDSYSP